MELNKYIDHTNLKNTSVLKDIEKLCNEAIKYRFASVCVYPYYVPLASSLLKDSNVDEIMAKEALRVLAMAYKILDYKPTEKDMKDIEKDLTYIGMVGMIDPPREEAKIAVEKLAL